MQEALSNVLRHAQARTVAIEILLEERSLLKMQLAKLTTKKHLMLLTEGDEETEAPNKGTLALQ